jgi:hypothetical protein
MGSPIRGFTIVSALALAPLAAWAALRLGYDPVRGASEVPLIHREGGYLGSEACRPCHGDHHATWERTFHRTMTQLPGAQTVVGLFDGQSVAYGGSSARVFEQDGRYLMDLPAAGGGRREAEVALAVGSRRYQQYFERVSRGDGFAFVRLPILWHIEARRWLHLNTVFLNPDSDDWDEHRADWNSNCIFCHNTGPEPRMENYRDPSRRGVESFQSEVAELGIACEACHGPGADHAEEQRDPLRRYSGLLTGARDPLIVQPTRLDQERAVGVCGQCHGQRLPEPISRVEAWLTTGPTYRSGERLLEHVAPVTAATPVRGGADPDLFRLRFWGDGTPRLTAYEYQGVTDSACYTKGSLTCGSCHTMHSARPGDELGNLTPPMRGNGACLQCHGELGRDLAAHTHHGPDSSGSQCMECHMPRVVYGVVEIHRSHRIEIPDAAGDAEAGRPNACTLCHLDQSPRWAARETARLWNRTPREPASRADHAPLDLPDSVASVLAGDAVQRAVWAKAMGRADAAVKAEDKAFLRLHLAITLGDGYPSIRWIAQRSLTSLEAELSLGLGPLLSSIDHQEGQEARRASLFAVLKALAALAPGKLSPPLAASFARGDFTLDLEAVIRLTDLQGERSISIGE